MRHARQANIPIVVDGVLVDVSYHVALILSV
jgi:hypothetical protein